ncbi:hypothetical protein MMC22_012086, partial [Lobaria immixta]|nr:hypothetical protein [Lobaria immixta]
MSNIFKLHGGKIIAGGGLIAAGYIFLMPGSSSSPALFRTPGVQNIENRYSSGGGSKHHTPGAGTTRGNSDDVAPRGDERNESSGMGSKEWKERIADQRPD